MRQVSRRSEVGNTKRRSLNTRLSSGTSAGTFAVCAGPYRNYHSNAGTKNEPGHVFGTISIKGLENWSSRFEPKNSWLSFSRGSGPPLKRFEIWATHVIETPKPRDCPGPLPLLSFLLGFQRPNLITGLSGWRVPDSPPWHFFRLSFLGGENPYSLDE